MLDPAPPYTELTTFDPLLVTHCFELSVVVSALSPSHLFISMMADRLVTEKIHDSGDFRCSTSLSGRFYDTFSDSLSDSCSTCTTAAQDDADLGGTCLVPVRPAKLCCTAGHPPSSAESTRGRQLDQDGNMWSTKI